MSRKEDYTAAPDVYQIYLRKNAKTSSKSFNIRQESNAQDESLLLVGTEVPRSLIMGPRSLIIG